MSTYSAADWVSLNRQLSFGIHRLVGWIFWDPIGIARYEALGIPDGLGYYIATRAAPLAPAGAQAVTAAFGSIHPDFVKFSIEVAAAHTDFDSIAEVRNSAVAHGLSAYVPDIVEPLAGFAEELWDVVDALPSAGRVLFAAHREAPRPADDAALSACLSSWLALNCIREWRGDTHWMLQVTQDISMTAAMVLDATWRGYEGDWLPRSRGASDADLAIAREELTGRGLATDGAVNAAGVRLRQEMEDRLDALTVEPWRRLGPSRSEALLGVIDAAGDRLMARVDATAGPLWMPAGRVRQEGS
jgi:hypothetical protein